MRMFSNLRTIVLQTMSTAGVAFKRLTTQWILSIAATAGLMIASAMVLSIPLYAEATYFRLLREEILAGRERDLATRPVDYAPLEFLFELKIAGRNSPQWDDVVEVDHFLSNEAPQTIGLPIVSTVRRYRTDGYNIFPPLDPEKPGSQYLLTTANFAWISPMEELVQVVSGRFPEPTSLIGGGAIEVFASEAIASEFGIQAGDTYFLRRDEVEIPVLVVGLWRALNPDAAIWDTKADHWFLVHEDTFTGPVSLTVDDELRSVVWSIQADGSRIHAADVTNLQNHIQAIQQKSAILMPGMALVSSPLDALARYQQNTPALTFLLLSFSIPILGLILTFIWLVANLFVGEQRGEMAIIRSRGASKLQIASISLFQGTLLGLIALTGGVLVSNGIAHLIGRSRSFMNFSSESGLRVSMTLPYLGYGILALGLILILNFLIPTIVSSVNTIVTYKQERARMMRPAWWQRYWVDVFLILPVAYGYWLLQNQSKLTLSGGKVVPDPFQNPLLLLVPAAGIFAATLLTLRIIPWIMNLISWMLTASKSVGLLMAARYLARSPAFYTAPLVLLVLTLGLSAFTASLARTLDSQLEKQMNYQVGSDLNIQELGTTANENNVSSLWTFSPVEEHLSQEGVRSATRVGRYAATAVIPGAAVEGTYLGIDRLPFPSTGYWQDDFSSQSLGELMNALAATPDGVLIPETLLSDHNLQIGDPLVLGVKTGSKGESIPLKLRIVGAFDLFPTWYPSDGPMFVGNLEELYLQAGVEYPHEVWLRIAEGADPERIVYGVRGFSILLDLQADHSRLVENGLNIFVKDWHSSGLNILAEQRRPDRQGLFGLLSVGFLASAILTVLGFLLYALFSFRRRFIEMGILRAIGLSVRQMIGLLAAELGLLILIGMTAGTALGILASWLFVPFLQIGTTTQSKFPPFEIVIAWQSIFQIYGLFVVLFISGLIVLVYMLRRMKIFQAIKLGETS